MPGDKQVRKNVFFRCDPKVYAAFAAKLLAENETATVNVGAALERYMQEAVAESHGTTLSEVIPTTKVSVDSHQEKRYDAAHVAVATQKVEDAMTALTEALSELKAAAGEDTAPDERGQEPADKLKLIADAAADTEELADAISRDTAELQARKAQLRDRNRDRHRNVSGGPA